MYYTTERYYRRIASSEIPRDDEDEHFCCSRDPIDGFSNLALSHASNFGFDVHIHRRVQQRSRRVDASSSAREISPPNWVHLFAQSFPTRIFIALRRASSVPRQGKCETECCASAEEELGMETRVRRDVAARDFTRGVRRRTVEV